MINRPLKMKADLLLAGLEISLRSDATRAYYASNEETLDALNRGIGPSRNPQAGLIGLKRGSVIRKSKLKNRRS